MLFAIVEGTFIFHFEALFLQNSLGGSLFSYETVHVFVGYGSGWLLLLWVSSSIIDG